MTTNDAQVPGVNSSAQQAAPPRTAQRLWLVRHGETAWSASGQHTSRTDLPLTEEGRRRAAETGRLLAGRAFSLVLTSPLQRAVETCRLAGYGDAAQIEPNLHEWNYGEYEGRTSAEIHAERPDWSLWRDGFPGGESLSAVAARAHAVISRALTSPGDVLLFGHGHILRVLTGSWLGLPPQSGSLFALGTAGVTTLGYEHENRVLTWFNGGLNP
jgi:broad specificity phosphatase PhoE